ncbi:MAG: hypothetical protein HND48_22715 [Chloroflexi bacterium]|nr:hypothetical protein [Chloroflexota bacterium]
MYGSARSLAGGVLTFFAVPAGLALPAAVLWIGAFAAAVVTHRRVCDAAVRTRELDAIKQAHLARMLLAWDGLPPARHTAAEPEHPYASDLDIIGPHGLLRLIDTTTSAAGSARLRDWLLAGTPDSVMIARRQALVAELRPLRTFRDRLTMSARRPAGGEGTLQAWLDDPHSAPPVPLAAPGRACAAGRDQRRAGDRLPVRRGRGTAAVYACRCTSC